MKILLAPDKFKEALKATEVCRAMRQGIKMADEGFEIQSLPLADGGEGTAEVLTTNLKGAYQKVKVHDPLGRPVEASIGLSEDRKTAFIEMAEASGLALLNPNERNCYHTSSYGTGELLLSAIQSGVKEIILGIGGSATCDGGIGMANALGYQFLDKEGKPVANAGKNLLNIQTIDDQKVLASLDQTKIYVACDVDNYLTGTAGAAKVYGPQKGADQKQVENLEEGLKNLAGRIEEALNVNVANTSHTGAAGGLGAGAKAFLGASLRTGIELIMEKLAFKRKLKNADLVITGEGKIDKQSSHGKVIKGVAQSAREFRIPVAGLCGTLDAPPEDVQKLGLNYAASIINKPCSKAEALNNTYEDLVLSAFNLAGLFYCRNI